MLNTGKKIIDIIHSRAHSAKNVFIISKFFILQLCLNMLAKLLSNGALVILEMGLIRQQKFLFYAIIQV